MSTYAIKEMGVVTYIPSKIKDNKDEMLINLDEGILMFPLRESNVINFTISS